MATSADSARSLARPRSELVLLAVAGALLAWLLLLAFLRHDGSPVGADAAVYVWWMRLAAHDGLSAIASRPGVPTLSSLLSGATGASAETTVAALGCVLVVVTALAGSALARAGGATDGVSATAAVLTGIFATYLAAGHLSNAAFAALFLAALACTVDHDRWRGAICGAALIGAAGLSHPDFLVAAVAIMGIAGVLALIARERREAITLVGVAAGGIGLAALGVLMTLTGGPRFDVDTSRDVFLLRVGQMTLLRRLYLERLAPKASGYVLWAWVPVAMVGLVRRAGAVGRLLVAWSGVTVVGVVVGIARQPFPPHRVIAFAFCLPILAAFGLRAIGARFGRARVPALIALIGIVAVSATLTWMRAPRPFDAPAAAAALRAVPAMTTTSAGDPIVVDLSTRGPGTVAAVLRAANLVRAEVPSERIRDVLVRFPRPYDADAEALALWTDTERHVAEAVASAPSTTEIRMGGVTETAVPHLAGATVVPQSAYGTPPAATSPLAVAAAAIAALLVLGITGAGWARAAGASGTEILERAPATGIGALILAGVAADRLGARLDGPLWAGALVILVAAAGYLTASLTRDDVPSPGAPRARRAGTTVFAPGRHPSLDTPSTA